MKRSVSMTTRAPRLRFLPDQVAEDAPLFEIVVILRAFHFFLHALWHHGQSDQLGMRMLQRRAGRLALILEQQDIAQPAVVLEIA